MIMFSFLFFTCAVLLLAPVESGDPTYDADWYPQTTEEPEGPNWIVTQESLSMPKPKDRRRFDQSSFPRPSKNKQDWSESSDHFGRLILADPTSQEDERPNLEADRSASFPNDLDSSPSNQVMMSADNTVTSGPTDTKPSDNKCHPLVQICSTPHPKDDEDIGQRRSLADDSKPNNARAHNSFRSLIRKSLRKAKKVHSRELEIIDEMVLLVINQTNTNRSLNSKRMMVAALNEMSRVLHNKRISRQRDVMKRNKAEALDAKMKPIHHMMKDTFLMEPDAEQQLRAILGQIKDILGPFVSRYDRIVNTIEHLRLVLRSTLQSYQMIRKVLVKNLAQLSALDSYLVTHNMNRLLNGINNQTQALRSLSSDLVENHDIRPWFTRIKHILTYKCYPLLEPHTFDKINFKRKSP
jgi:hypothetical protein